MHGVDTVQVTGPLVQVVGYLVNELLQVLDVLVGPGHAMVGILCLRRQSCNVIIEASRLILNHLQLYLEGVDCKCFTWF